MLALAPLPAVPFPDTIQVPVKECPNCGSDRRVTVLPDGRGYHCGKCVHTFP